MALRFLPGVVLLLLGFCAFAKAQAPVQAPLPFQHNHGNIVEIDGREHPELISDSSAYRHYLLAISPKPIDASEQERAQHRAQIGSLQLHPEDTKKLLTILSNFKTQHDVLVQRFNEQASAAQKRGELIDPALFLKQRDDLVESTRSAIGRELSSEAARTIANRVQQEKRNIVVHTNIHKEDGR